MSQKLSPENTIAACRKAATCLARERDDAGRSPLGRQLSILATDAEKTADLAAAWIDAASDDAKETERILEMTDGQPEELAVLVRGVLETRPPGWEAVAARFAALGIES